MTRNIKNIGKIISLVAFDTSAFYCSLLAAFYTRKFLTIIIPTVLELRLSIPYFLKIWWLPVVFISFIAYERLYIKNLSFWDETHELLKAVTVSMITVLAVLTVGRMTPDISRLTVFFLWLYGLFLFPFFRFIGKRILYRTGLWKENVIIIGAGKAGIAAAKGIQAEIHLGYHVIGFLDDADDKIGTELSISDKRYRVFGKTKNFSKFVRMLNISTIIIAIPSLRIEKLTELTNNIQKYAKNILLIPDLKGIALTNTELHHLFFQQLFLLKINNNLKSPYNRFIKRTFDLAVSILFMPVLIPFICMLGLLIKLDSPGPVFYRHKRVGRNRKAFGVYKFRSMFRDSRERLEKILKTDPEAKKEWETSFKLRNDPRITRMGAFLRKTSLDELPQIFNVLKSEMSLVGPRPVIDEEITKYYKECADYYHLVRPGITGLWQVSGRNDVDYDVRVRLDTWYVLNWSVWLDVLMLLKTIRVVLKREGAY
jgi:undecaprenyl-phosphate galactose phosphotransferase